MTMTETSSLSGHPEPPALPCRAELLVAQRPPMLLAGELRRRERTSNFSEVGARVPESGIFVGPDGRTRPEFFIELAAQAMAAVDGYDAMVDGKPSRRGLLVGIDRFSWSGSARCGEELRVEVAKTFEFGPVTIMSGRVVDQRGELLAAGEIKAWEQP